MYKNKFSSLQLLRIALLLWIAYFLLLGLLDGMVTFFQSKVSPYYAIQAFNGFIILALTWLPWKPQWLERAMVPLTLVLMTILPMLTVSIMPFLASPPSRATMLSPEGMTFRLMPILLMSLLLTGTIYKFKHVVLFCLVTTIMNLITISIPPATNLLAPFPHPPAAPLLLPPPGTPPPPPGAPPPPLYPLAYEGILVTAIQTLSFLIVGYFTSALTSRLRAQQRSLEEANAQLRDQARTQKELTISQERNRMARELHDTLAHTLSGLSLQLQTVKAYWKVDPATAQEMLDRAVAATRSGLQEVRRALKALRAAPLEDLGLSLAIRQVAESVAERGNLELNLSITEPLPSFTAEVSQCFYRVAQEAIMNVLYHANAKRLSVTLKVKDDGALLKIEDDGMGFDVTGEYAGHWGVQGMRERAELVGGRLLIKSQRHHGTTIQLYIEEKER